MQQIHLLLDNSPTVPAPVQSIIPAHLGREAVVSCREPSLRVSDMEIRQYLRDRLSLEQLNDEIDRIWALSASREEFGILGAFEFESQSSAYACIYSGPNALGWLYAHERQRLNQLQQALPTPGEEVAEARERIKARIASRRAARTLACA